MARGWMPVTSGLPTNRELALICVPPVHEEGSLYSLNMTLHEWIRTSKLFRFVVLVPFWGLMFLLISVILHRKIDWGGSLIFGLIAGAFYTFVPPIWWRDKFKSLSSSR